jgi:hypothetical protein
MSIRVKTYPSKSGLTLTNKFDSSYLVLFDGSLLYSSKDVRRLICLDVYASLHWYPIEQLQSDLRKLSKYYTNEEIRDMAKDTIWVKNNLTDAEIQDLDSEYPSPDAINAMIETSIEFDCNVVIRANNNGGYITFINQGDYAVSGRSATAFDSLVIALYKLQLCEFNLGLHAEKPTAGGVKRG